MAQLQEDLLALQQQHRSQTAQMCEDRQSLLANIAALEDQSAQLQGKLDMSRCVFMHVAQSRERHYKQTTSTVPLVGDQDGVGRACVSGLLHVLPHLLPDSPQLFGAGSQICKSPFCCLVLFVATLFCAFWLQAERTTGRRRGQAAA